MMTMLMIKIKMIQMKIKMIEIEIEMIEIKIEMIQINIQIMRISLFPDLEHEVRSPTALPGVGSHRRRLLPQVSSSYYIFINTLKGDVSS